MKIYNIFDKDRDLVDTVNEANLSDYILWKKKQLEKEASDYHTLLSKHEFELSEPEWYHDGNEFGYRFTSHHPSYGHQKPHTEKHAVQYCEVKLWTLDQTEPS